MLVAKQYLPKYIQGSHIRVYNSEKNWKVHKDITCKRLRWTISDIALSPDQQFLVILLYIFFEIIGLEIELSVYSIWTS